MRRLIERNRHSPPSLDDYKIGCILLNQPFFFKRQEWIAEQKCVVARVDELMAMFDELETQVKQSSSISDTVMAAVVDKLPHHSLTFREIWSR